MSELLRNFVAMKLGSLWQKTLTSGHLLKQVLSPKESPQSIAFPINKQHADPSQLTFLPQFDSGESKHGEGATGRADSGADLITQILPTGDGPAHGPYADMSTQTEWLIPPITQSSETPNFQVNSDADSSSNKFGEESFEDSNAQETSDDTSHTQDEVPEIFDGKTELLVTHFNDKRHLAILLTEEIIYRLNDLSRESRKLGRIEQKIAKVDHDVNLARIEVQFIEDSIEEAGSEETWEERINELREELGERQRTLCEAQARKDLLTPDLDIYKRNTSYIEAMFIEIFQDKLGEAGLLETSEEEPDQQDGEKDTEDGSRIESDVLSDDSSQSNVSIGQLARMTAYNEFRRKGGELMAIEHAFDTRDEAYASALRKWKQQKLDGEHTQTREMFDQQAFEATREIAREYAAAEEAFEEAQARMNKFGPNGSDQESGFVDEEEDGCFLSGENDSTYSIPVDRINDWLPGILDIEEMPEASDLNQGAGLEFGPQESDSIDECDIRSASMSDSCSCHNMTRERRHIDRWRQIAGRTR
ncbi:MAG: hypothetical protein Q9183_002773 [Haloplaca sp. 2 TL-2023]